MKEEIFQKLQALQSETDTDELFAKVTELREELLHLSENKKQEVLEEIAAENITETKTEEEIPGEEKVPVENATEEKTISENHIDEKLHDIFSVFDTRRKKFRAAKRAQAKDILKEKENIIDELIKLISNEEHIGKAFAQFKELQQKWNDLGSVAGIQYKNLQSIYSRHVHNFFYNMKLSRDLKELDMRKNSEFRDQIIHRINLLSESKSIHAWERGVKKFRAEWEASGPVDHDKFDELRIQYRDAIRKVYNQIREFYTKRREHEKENLEKKNILIEKLKSLNEQTFERNNHWQSATKEVMQLMEEWKKIGYAPKEVNENIWHEFRNAMNDFFKKKKAFFDELKKISKEVKERKQSLIEKVEAIQNPDDWNEAAKQVIALQRQWKESGYLDPRTDQKMWEKFRGACNKFFDAKDEKNKEADAELIKNLELKEELIKRIESFSPTAVIADDMKALKDFSMEWGTIGHVPFRNKNSIYEKYSKALDAQYDRLRMDQKEKHILKFRNKIDHMAQSDNGSNQVMKEKNNLRDQCHRLEATIIQYENNLGFFSKSKKGNPLMMEAEANLQKAKEELIFLKQKLSAFSQS